MLRNDSGDQDEEEDDADDQQRDAALVEDHPADVKGQRRASVSTPRVMKRAMVPRRRVMFIGLEKV